MHEKDLSTSLILGYVDYASVSLFYSLNSSFRHKLQVVQIKVFHFILINGHWEHIGNTDLKRVRFLNTEDRVTQLAVNLVHGLLYNQ